MTEDRVERKPPNGHEILEKLAALPISEWSYAWDGPSVRYLGPMAQDFAGAFALDNDGTKINLLDANGVTMVAVQALYRRLVALEAQVAELRRLASESQTRTPG